MQNSNIFSGTIPRNPILGEKKVCFRSSKMYPNSPTAIQNSKLLPGDNTQDLRFRGGKAVFVLWKITKTRQKTEMQNSKISGGQNPGPSSILWERKVCFRPSKMYQNFSYSHAEFQKKSEGRNPGSPFLGKGYESCLLLKWCLATPLWRVSTLWHFWHLWHLWHMWYLRWTVLPSRQRTVMHLPRSHRMSTNVAISFEWWALLTIGSCVRGHFLVHRQHTSSKYSSRTQYYFRMLVIENIKPELLTAQFSGISLLRMLPVSWDEFDVKIQ